MSATISAEPRRDTAGGLRSDTARGLRRDKPSADKAREVPVLFHLRDACRPALKTKAPAIEPLLAVAAQASADATADCEESQAAAFESPPFAEATPPGIPDQLPSAEILPSAEAIAPPPEELAAPAITTPESAPLTPTSKLADEPPASESAPPSTAHATPRQDRTTRPSKSRRPAKSDWFTTHGKYIAIGFVLALIATIYLARSNRSRAPAVANSQPHSHPGEAGSQLASGEAKLATVVVEAKKTDESSSAASSTAETSPAKLVDASPAEPSPQAELHAPAMPQAVREPGAPGPIEDGSLFPWTERPGDRLAARPPAQPGQEAQPSTAAAPAAPPAPAAAPPLQYPVTNASAPVPQQSYPVTATPGVSFPAPPATPANNAAEQNRNFGDLRSPYLAPAQPPANPAMSGQTLAQPPTNPMMSGQTLALPPGGTPSPYTPQDNTARGYRYERTGSGPY